MCRIPAWLSLMKEPTLKQESSLEDMKQVFLLFRSIYLSFT